MTVEASAIQPPRTEPSRYLVAPLYDWVFFILCPLIALALGIFLARTGLGERPNLAEVAAIEPVAAMLPVTVSFPVETPPVKLAVAPETEPVALRLPVTVSFPVTAGSV